MRGEVKVVGKRERLAQVLDRSGVLRAAHRVRGLARAPMLTVLTYHRIARTTGHDDFDEGVIDATPEQFDDQLAFLADRFRFVGIDDVLAHFRGRPLPPNPVLLTFDDGYRECVSVALPLLQKHGARAAFFIATHYTEHRRIFWWDRITYLVNRCQRSTLTLQIPRPQVFDLAADRAGTIARLIKLVKTHYGLDLDALLEELEVQCDVSFSREDERRSADRLIMNWDDVLALERAGMDVHSHTRRHRVLNTLAPEQLADELVGSRRDVEQVIGRPVRAVAYPVGFPVRELRRVRSALSDAGYEAGFTNSTGPTYLGAGVDLFDLRRMAMDIEFSPTYFRAIMAIPQLCRTRAAH